MTRMAPYIILVVGAACGGPDLLTAPGPTSPGPAGSRFTVTGVVYDSLASHVGPSVTAPGVRVSFNGVVDITDAAGRFTLNDVLGGSHVPFELLSLNYEPRADTMLIDRDLTVSLPLRRLAPLITAFFPAGDTTRFIVVDLQSRKTVERWQRTRATMTTGTTQWTQYGDQWVWTPIDILTWLVSMPNTAGAEDFRFDIHDAIGFTSHAVCRVDSGCDHLWPPRPPDEADPE